MKNKIALIFGKGVDGCGVTRGAKIFEKWVHDNGAADTIIVDFDNDQDMVRSNNIQWMGKVLKVDKTDKEVSAAVLKAVNECDIVIVHSYPTRKRSDYIERFRTFLEKVTDPIVVCHDHAISQTTMSAISQSTELYSMSDVFVPQSMSGLSSQSVELFDPGMKGRIIENPIWIDPTYLDKFNKPVTEREKHFMYIGRHSPIKDPAMVCRTQPYLPDWRLTFMGCERSISSVTLPPGTEAKHCRCAYIPEYQPMIHFRRMNKAKQYVDCSFREALKPVEDIKIQAYETYAFEDGMSMLGSSLASWCGYGLTDVKEYGTRMEYTMIESFLLTMPILSDHFVENAFSPEGKKWKDYDFILSSSMGKEKELADTLHRLWDNKKEWAERNAANRELINKFNSIDTLAPNYLRSILKHGKRENKVNGIDRISEYFPEAKELRAAGSIIVSHATSVMNKSSYILVDGKQEEYKEKPNTADLSDFF